MWAVAFATRDQVDWYDNRRLLELIGTMPLAEAEEHHSARTRAPALVA